MSLQKETDEIVRNLQDSFDKTQIAQTTLDSVTDKMRNNLSKIMGNSSAVNEMDIRADGLKNSAMDFQFGANRLEKMARARRLRNYLMLAGFVLAFMLFIYLFS